MVKIECINWRQTESFYGYFWRIIDRGGKRDRPIKQCLKKTSRDFTFNAYYRYFRWYNVPNNSRIK